MSGPTQQPDYDPADVENQVNQRNAAAIAEFMTENRQLIRALEQNVLKLRHALAAASGQISELRAQYGSLRGEVAGSGATSPPTTD